MPAATTISTQDSEPPLITSAMDEEFAARGYVHCAAVLPADVVARASAVIDHLYSSPEANVGHPGNRTDGVTQYCADPGLLELFSQPALERIAQSILRTDAVVLQSSAILHTRTQQGMDSSAPLFTEESEHVDVQYSLEEIDGTPRLQTCMLMVLVADLPLGRANTYFRPGSHRLISEYLLDNGLEPFKAHPTFKLRNDGTGLPKLPFADLEPVTGRAGDVIAFCTNVVHCASRNIDTETRKILFINFCAQDALDTTAGNHDLALVRTTWREALASGLPPDRRHLLHGVETINTAKL